MADDTTTEDSNQNRKISLVDRIKESVGLIEIIEDSDADDEENQSLIRTQTSESVKNSEKALNDEKMTQIIREKIFSQNDDVSRFLTVYDELSDYPEEGKRVQKALKLANVQSGAIAKILKSTLLSLPTFMDQQREIDVRSKNEELQKLKQEASIMSQEVTSIEQQRQELQQRLDVLHQNIEASERLIAEKTQQVQATSEVYSRVTLNLQTEMQTISSLLTQG